MILEYSFLDVIKRPKNCILKKKKYASSYTSAKEYMLVYSTRVLLKLQFISIGFVWPIRFRNVFTIIDCIIKINSRGFSKIYNMQSSAVLRMFVHDNFARYYITILSLIYIQRYYY